MKLTLENTERGYELHGDGEFVAEVVKESEGIEIVDCVNKLHSIEVIETQNNDGTEWALSFDGHNPSNNYYFPMPKETAFGLKNFLSQRS